MADGAARRVNGSLLPHFLNQPVTLIGKIVANEPGYVILESSDGKNINVNISRAVPSNWRYAEFSGTVVDGQTIQETDAYEGRAMINEGFDMVAYNEMVVTINGAFAKIF